MNVVPVKTRIFKEGDDLLAFIRKYVKTLPERSLLVVTSKIVALAEGRSAIAKTEREKGRLIKQESEWAMRTKYVWLTIRDRMVMASAGIDESNGNGKLILLPKDSFAAAAHMRKQLQKHYGVKKLGVIVSDSRAFPLRSGIVGVALGYAGFKGIKNYCGKPDIFGRKFLFSKVDIADSLATAAVLTMGEGNERQPLAVIKDPPVQFVNRISRHELEINLADDLYQPFFENIKTLHLKK